ncbi:hypothetical protein ACRALDRAFT_1026356 [Sodiomyces alcalophilus JCM 7366]|uniref:uncharacterized protein n=1 Tax=Sodiomyces alcalophilus JCM 7366 TaxID=591952 RepID=UPI0039B37E36
MVSQGIERLDAIEPVFTRDTVRSVRAFARFFLAWLRIMWPDLLTMAVLAGVALGIHFAPLGSDVSRRTFPITFDGSGDIIYPTLAYPDRGWIIDSWLSGLLSSAVPILVVLVAQFHVRSFWDTNNAIMGIVSSILTGTLFQVVVKQVVGSFRPSFLDVCMPDVSLAAAHNASGLNGVGFQQVFYTAEICTQPDKEKLKVAMTSFPSGHATVAAAAYVFLALYINGKAKVFSARRPRLFDVALLLNFLLTAFVLSAILTVDQAHHWYDIVAGFAISTITALVSYRASYAAIWDWRFNHIPLLRNRTFSYDFDIPTYVRPTAIDYDAGWGIGDHCLRFREKPSATGDPPVEMTLQDLGRGNESTV